MKNTSKFIILCLSLALLIGSAFGIAVSASEGAEGTEIEILAQNVVYGEKVSVAYAVDATVADAVAGNVKVSYYLAADPDTVYEAKLLDTTNPKNLYEDENGTTYPVFATMGFAAKDFTDVVFATAYESGTLPSEASYKEYSVAEYLYARLYKDNFINITDTASDDYDRKQLYLALIDYGKYAQEVIVNNDLADEDKEALITDYTYVYFPEKNGTVNGKTSGLFLTGDTVTVNYTGTRSEINGWYVKDESSYGTVAATSADNTLTDTFTVSDSAFMALAPWLYDFITFESTDASIESSLDENITAEIASDPQNADNTVYKISGNGESSGTKYSYVALTVENEESSRYVFETDVYVDGTTENSATAFQIGFSNSSQGAPVSELRLQVKDGVINVLSGGDIPAANTMLAEHVANTGEWFKIRIELNYTGSTNAMAKVYVNGELVVAETEVYSSARVEGYEIATFRIRYNATKVLCAYFDNMFLVQDTE